MARRCAAELRVACFCFCAARVWRGVCSFICRWLRPQCLFSCRPPGITFIASCSAGTRRGRIDRRRRVHGAWADVLVFTSSFTSFISFSVSLSLTLLSPPSSPSFVPRTCPTSLDLVCCRVSLVPLPSHCHIAPRTLTHPPSFPSLGFARDPTDAPSTVLRFGSSPTLPYASCSASSQTPPCSPLTASPCRLFLHRCHL